MRPSCSEASPAAPGSVSSCHAATRGCCLQQPQPGAGSQARLAADTHRPTLMAGGPGRACGGCLGLLVGVKAAVAGQAGGEPGRHDRLLGAAHRLAGCLQLMLHRLPALLQLVLDQACNPGAPAHGGRCQGLRSCSSLADAPWLPLPRSVHGLAAPELPVSHPSSISLAGHEVILLAEPRHTLWIHTGDRFC